MSYLRILNIGWWRENKKKNEKGYIRLYLHYMIILKFIFYFSKFSFIFIKKFSKMNKKLNLEYMTSGDLSSMDFSL